MSKFRVGSVPYANAIPLVAEFEKLGESSPVQVLYDVPAKLPFLLEQGVSAILVSSVDALRVPGRQMAAGVCIGSNGPVKSVRIFSKVPPNRIRSLALDSSSMTSNRLAAIVLRERYGVDPICHSMRPSQQDMLAECDACVLIGDIGMTAPDTDLHTLDLGGEWTSLTGLPFVWAAWIGNAIDPELAERLKDAAAEYDAPDRHDELAQFALTRLDWQEETIRDYFFHVMVYKMGEQELLGLREFQKRLLANGFDDCRHFPSIVAARP